jgi:TolB-like protein/DNA-binding winged helix-turn-helix (wHTH) protein
MDRLTAIPLRVGAWCVDPRTGQMSRDGEVVRVEARTLKLLMYLAERSGEVVSIDELLNHVWSGVVVSPDSVYQGVAALRRMLGDDAKQPQYIATVPRLGYRMVAQVGPWVEEPFEVAGRAVTTERPAGVLGVLPTYATGSRPLLVALAVACLAALTVLLLNSNLTARRPASTATSVPARSVAVLAFLDLTSQAMSEEYFADGITEELIDKLSKISALHVAPPTSSFYFKGKRATVADMARSLGVAYILDGSVRKSGSMLRISARLVRAADGYVAWSETYDRPEGDKLWVQEDIANEVARALGATIH